MPIAQNLFRNFYWKSFQFIISFIINVVLVRWFQSSISGEFYSFIYLLSICVFIFTLGFDISINYFLARRQLKLRSAYLVMFGMVALALLICLPVIRQIVLRGNYPQLEASRFLLYASLYIAGNLFSVFAGAVFNAFEQGYQPAKLSAIVNAVMLLLAVVLSLNLDRAVWIGRIFMVYFAFSFLQGILILVWSAFRFSNDVKNDLPAPAGIKLLFTHSFRLFFINLLFFSAARICITLLPMFVSPAELGNYITAFKIVEWLEVMASFIYYPFIAIIAARDQQRTENYVLLLVRISNTLVLVFGIFNLFIGRFIYTNLFGLDFGMVDRIVTWLLPGLFAACSSTYFTAYYFGKNLLNYNLVSASLLLVFMITLFFVLIRPMGIEGAAIAFSLSALISWGYDAIIFRKFLRYDWRDVLIVRKSDFSAIFSLLAVK